jgi:hypothetical protein
LKSQTAMLYRLALPALAVWVAIQVALWSDKLEARQPAA